MFIHCCKIACPTPEEAQKWMEAFHRAKQQVLYHLYCFVHFFCLFYILVFPLNQFLGVLYNVIYLIIFLFLNPTPTNHKLWALLLHWLFLNVLFLLNLGYSLKVILCSIFYNVLYLYYRLSMTFRMAVVPERIWMRRQSMLKLHIANLLHEICIHEWDAFLC